MAKVIGIDLGTTNSCVSVYENKETKIIQNKEGKNTTPSIVAFTDKNEVLVGDPAKRQAITNPEKTIDSIKRIMGLMYDEDKIKDAKKKTQYNIVNKNGVACVEIGDKIYTPQEISAKILTKLKEDAEEYLSEKVNDAVITVPAYFNDAQRKATQEAGVIAGLNVLRIINEPTSASLAYGLDKQDEEKILVFDFGGGTMDVSLLEIGDGTFEVLATDGNAFLGGKDIDNRIAEYLISEFTNSTGVDISKDKMAMQRIMDASESAKKELSSTNETNINLPFLTATDSGPQHLNINLTRAKFESLIDDLIDETLEHVKNVLNESNTEKEDVNEIIMVGGSTRIPIVEEKINTFLNGKKVNKSVNPDEVVSAGASIQGAVLQGSIKDVLLLDVAPLSIGIETMGGIMTKLIEKGTTIPASKSEIFSTAEDNQSAVTIRIGQGESELFNNNKNLGNFNLEGIPPANRGVPQIEVKLDIDANGVLTVKALEKNTNKEQSITISGSSGLSDDEINQMVQDAEKDNANNKSKVEAIKKRNELDGLVFQIEKTSKEQNIKLEEITGMVELINKAKDLVKNQSEDKIIIEKTINDLNNIVSQMQKPNNSQENREGENDIIDAEVS